MKKDYMKPSMLVLKLKPTTIICTSPVPPYRYPGPFGYVNEPKEESFLA